MAELIRTTELSLGPFLPGLIQSLLLLLGRLADNESLVPTYLGIQGVGQKRVCDGHIRQALAVISVLDLTNLLFLRNQINYLLLPRIS